MFKSPCINMKPMGALSMFPESEIRDHCTLPCSVCVLSRFGHVWLCDPIDCSPPGSSVHGIPQQEYQGGLLCPPLGDLPNPGIEPVSLMSPALAASFFTTTATWEARCLSIHTWHLKIFCRAFPKAAPPCMLTPAMCSIISLWWAKSCYSNFPKYWMKTGFLLYGCVVPP